ncbi:MAG: hypothetical protein HY738_05500 [Bacteroidia bacterium]|nr:hypothetical protein [Bacteroidia bacterium]
MKTLAILSGLSIIMIFSVSAFSDNPDTTRVKVGKKKIIIIDQNDEIAAIEEDTTVYDFNIDEESQDTCETEHFSGHWFGVDIGLNNFVNSSYELALPKGAEYLELNTGKSWGVGVNILEKSFNIYQEQMGFVTGIGFEFNNYRFSKNITLLSGNDTLSYVNDTIKYIKNKLAATYVTVPLLFEVQIPLGVEEDNNLHFAIGGIGAIKIGSHLKQVFVENGIELTDKVSDDFHLNMFRYGLTARLGYEGVNLFANYYISPLFEGNNNPELYPFTVGFSVTF